MGSIERSIGAKVDNPTRGVARLVFNKVRSQPLPAYGESAYYGPALRQLDGEWVLQWKGESALQNARTRVDLFGDRNFRKLDYHIARDPLKLLIRRPKMFVETLRTAPKARRGTAPEVWEEVQRLHLDNVYQPYRRGDEVTGIKIDTNLAETSPTLWDIMFAQKGSMKNVKAGEGLLQIDRFDAYGKTARYKAELDAKYGYSNIDGPWSVFFRNVTDNKVEDPIANIPDIIPNRAKVTKNEYHALTLAMLMINVVGEEFKMPDGASGDPVKAARAILDGYNDPKVAEYVTRYMKMGRITLPGDNKAARFRELRSTDGTLSALGTKAKNITPKNVFNWAVRKVGTIHNKAAMRVKRGDSANIREIITSSCKDYLDTQKPAA